MFLRTLTLRQFRNYATLDGSFDPRLNLFIGPNGSGKSNLMEAVSVLATGRSHRGADPKHLLQWGTSGFALAGVFGGEEDVELEIRQKAGRPRQVLVNGAAQKRLRQWVGRVPVVSFSPDDLDMVKGEPSVRRRVLNAVLCQTDPAYLDALQRYNKVMEERNAALRQVQEREQPPGILEPWDAALVKEGVFLSLARRLFISEFGARVAERHAALTGGREKAAFGYKPSLHRLEEGEEVAVASNRRRQVELREAEVALGASLIGPHRDDVELSLNGSPARAYASQGQQRTLALAVKLAELEYVTARLGRRPVCLLDDMLSELDPSRRDNLVSALGPDAQCFVSLTDLSEWPAGSLGLAGAGLYEVRGGALVPRPGRAA
jgi:DNA replication and repair protein RecF